MSSVVVVGSGIIGLCSAHYARRDAHRVIVLERGPAERDCCSLGNSGLIVPSHFIPLASPDAIGVALRSLFNPRSPLRAHPRLDRNYLSWCWRFLRNATSGHVERSAPALRDLSLLSIRCYERLVEELGNRFSLQRRGLLMLCRTQYALDEEARVAEMAMGLGIPSQVLDAAATAKLEPAMAMSVAGSVHYPLDAHLTPQSLVAELTAALEHQGVEFRWSTPALGWRTQGSRVHAVMTGKGEIVADEFVLACGSWSQRVSGGLDIQLPLEAGKGYSLTLPRPRSLPVMSAILTEARIAVTPMGGTLRFAGTLELAGLDTSIDARRVQAMIDAIAGYYPEFGAADFAGVPAWSGLRPCSPDGLPYIGRARAYDNLVVATGHAMMGVSTGPATGQLVADLIAGRKPAIAIGRFEPDRFA